MPYNFLRSRSLYPSGKRKVTEAIDVKRKIERDGRYCDPGT